MSPRGAGWLFGSAVTKEFTELNNLDLICRAHQLVQEGYKFWFDEEKLGMYACICYVWMMDVCVYVCEIEFELIKHANVFSISFSFSMK